MGRGEGGEGGEGGGTLAEFPTNLVEGSLFRARAVSHAAGMRRLARRGRRADTPKAPDLRTCT